MYIKQCRTDTCGKMADLIVALHKAKYERAAWRLASCSASLLKTAVQKYMRQPFQSLRDAANAQCKRAIAFSIVHTELAPMCTMPVSLEDFTQSYTMHSTFLAASQKEGYIYQFARTCVARQGDSRFVVDGQVVQRVFIHCPSVTAALQFYNRWSCMQKGTQTSLLECHCHHDRKWIMDIDASAQGLRSAGLSDEPIERLNALVIELAVETIAYLKEFITQGCNFAIVSRHTVSANGAVKKLSWHITLMAEGCLHGWTTTMFKIQKMLKVFIHCIGFWLPRIIYTFGLVDRALWRSLLIAARATTRKVSICKRWAAVRSQQAVWISRSPLHSWECTQELDRNSFSASWTHIRHTARPACSCQIHGPSRSPSPTQLQTKIGSVGFRNQFPTRSRRRTGAHFR